MPSFICELCGLAFSAYAKNRKFCSRSCFERSIMGKPNPKATMAMRNSRLGKSSPHNRDPLKIERQRQKLIGRKRPDHAKAMTGEKNPAWHELAHRRGYGKGWLNKSLREDLISRDGYRCYECGSNPPSLARHHIDYDKSNCSLSNLVLLCNSCHSKTNYDRGRWEAHFRKSLNESNENHTHTKFGQQGNLFCE